MTRFQANQADPQSRSHRIQTMAPAATARLLSERADELGLTVSALSLQMIEHCLGQMELDAQERVIEVIQDERSPFRGMVSLDDEGEQA